MSSMTWWGLVVIGVLLMTSEMLVTAFVLLWFGIGFIVSGLITFMYPQMNLGIQLLLAAFIGFITLILGRRYCIQTKNATETNLYTFDGGSGYLVIRENEGRKLISVSCRGTYWSIANPELLDDHPEWVDGVAVKVEKIIDNKAVISDMSRDSE
ncbi:MAG: hypothetical protein CENE_00792 [Candidatus Celerinatantimonas neptuna]|nr:MAG: hypothetical protein CENE_00792 [Candidatus Celerinatantimonas neptuna]